MKKAILNKDRKLEVMEMLPPGTPPGGVLIAMRRCAICRTDLKMVQAGQKDLSLPRILGHEGVGEIIESRDPLFKTGDMVAIYPGVFCGECDSCRMGYTARCEKGRIYGFNEDGLFRSIIPFPEKQLSSLIPFTQGVDQELAALAEPLACCLSAVRMFEHAKKESALIIGAGFIGSLFAALLRTQGWRKIIVADKNSERLSKELPQGVKVIDTSRATLTESLRNEEIDLIVPACPDGLDWPFWKVMKKGGCVSSFSGNQEGKELQPIDMNAVHYKELTIAGSYGCNIGDFRSALNMLAQREIDLGFFNFYRIPIEGIPDGMEVLRRQETKKIIITRL